MKKARKSLSLILAMAMILGIIVIAPTTASAESYEYAMYPGDVLQMTQGAYAEYNAYSHNGQTGYVQNAFDMVGNSVYKAPFTGTIVKIGSSLNVVAVASENKVYWADGTLDYLTVYFMHDNNISDITDGARITQGTPFYHPGTAGGATGSHLHIYARRGRLTAKNMYGGSGDVYVNNALYIKNTTSVVQTGGYSWKTAPTDSQPPTINRIYISQVNDTGFRVCFEASDNIGITSAKVATWATGDMSDLIWHNCSYNGSGTYFVDLKRSDYAPEATFYISHAYVYDAAGNSSSKEITKSYNEGYSVVNSIYYSQITRDTFRICCEVNDVSNVDSVRVATWATGNMSDIKWTDCSYNGVTTYFAELNRNDYISGAKLYISHVYIKFKSGIEQSFERSIKYEDESPVISNIQISNITENGFLISCKIEDESRIKSVQFPTWLASDPKQSDIKWHEATIEDDIAKCYIAMADHNNLVDTYFIHVYAYDSFDNLGIAMVTVDMKAVLEEQQRETTDSTITEPTQATTVMPTETSTEITEPTQPSTTKPTEPIETQPTTVKTTEPTEPTPATEEKIDISKWQVSGIYNKQYTGKYIKQYGITVYNDGEYADIKVKYRNNLNAGTAAVIITGIGDYTGTITKTFKINKAKNPMLTWRDTEAVFSKTLKKHKVIVKGVIGAYNYQGSVTFTKLSGSKSLTISKGGVITVKKGKYKKNSILSMKVKITAKGNANYMSKSKKMTVKIKIK